MSDPDVPSVNELREFLTGQPVAPRPAIVAQTTEVLPAPIEGAPLVPLRLVPVEVFGGDGCGDTACAHCKEHAGFGLMDAVQAWSDCNRAEGMIYRVEDAPLSERGRDTDPERSGRYREPGDTMVIYVRPEDVAWFERRHGDRFAT